MALNFSHRAIFPAHLPEDNLASTMRITNGCHVEGIQGRSGDGFSRSWHSNVETQDPFDHGGEDMDLGGSQDSVSKDILDLLPADPFGMDIKSTVTAITGWLEDLEVDYGSYGRADVGMNYGGDYSLFAGWNFIWNKAMTFQAFPGSLKVDDKVVSAGRANRFFGPEEMSYSIHRDGSGSASSMQDMTFSKGNDVIDQNKNYQKVDEDCADVDAGSPHSALTYALGYLGVRDLLAVERVCKSLCYTVRNDNLLWKCIHIDKPFNDKFTDDVLLQLTSRAQGKLQCLSLVDCQKITDDALRRVLESNPRLTKLSVPGCTRLTIDSLISCLRAFNSMASPGIKYLRIGGLYGVTEEHFEELKSLLGIRDKCTQVNSYKPHFYRKESVYLSCEDERQIDIAMCPRCQNLRLVYDCPVKGCRGSNHETQVCKACVLCIIRCSLCGRCVNDEEYEETFCLEARCSDCWKASNSQERHDTRAGSSGNTPGREPVFSFHG